MTRTKNHRGSPNKTKLLSEKTTHDKMPDKQLTLMEETAKDELPGVAVSFSCSTPCMLSVLLATLAVLLTLAFLVLSSSAL